ncbi:MAG: radical SAM protein, partial [Candidatus Omnitrophica bacterium]|nr:radical SAM protein [Candidatus Omnitrophota bacterium]
MEKFLKRKVTRRQFLKEACVFCLGLAAASFTDFFGRKSAQAKEDALYLHEARFYDKIDENTVQCKLCPRGCTLSEGQRSFCRVREPHEGKLYSLVYGSPCAIHVDPIEKKPLFHFLPGTPIFSIATAGCNYRCKFCQNWSISQSAPEELESYELSPQEVVSEAVRNGCPSIAYTYTEPSVFYEYMVDTARIAKARGVRNMYHSNGSLNPDAVRELSM